MSPIRVLIVEDSATFVKGLKATLDAETDLVVVGSAGNQAEAVELSRKLQPDVALVDLRLAPEPDLAADFSHGLKTIRMLKATMPNLRILAMSFYTDAQWPIRAVQAKASGFVSKDDAPEAIADALRTVARGGVFLTAEQLARVTELSAGQPPGLTPRERDVLRLLAQGKTNPEIAQTLGVAVGTVRTHVGNILGKLGVGSRQDAVAEARLRGLIPDE